MQENNDSPAPLLPVAITINKPENGIFKEETNAAVKSRKRHVSWDKDAIGDGLTSIECVLEWLTIENNFNRWRGICGGATKKTLAKEIIEILNREGIQDRSIKDVKSKVDEMQRKFEEVELWKRTKGDDILKVDGPSKVEELIKKRFKYYYILEGVIRERFSIRPLFAMDNIIHGPFIPRNIGHDEEFNDVVLNDNEVDDSQEVSINPCSAEPTRGEEGTQEEVGESLLKRRRFKSGIDKRKKSDSTRDVLKITSWKKETIDSLQEKVLEAALKKLESDMIIEAEKIRLETSKLRNEVFLAALRTMSPEEAKNISLELHPL